MENNDTNSATKNPAGAVMDVQAPKNTAPVVNSSNEPEDATTPPVEDATPPVNEEAKPQDEVAPPENVPVSDPVIPTEAAVSDQPPADQNPMAIDTEQHPHKKGAPLAVIIVTIVVALLLAGATVLAYMSTKKTKSDSTKSSGSTSAQKATTNDIDQTNSDVDSTINKVDDVKDFAGDDLSDKALGL